MKLEQIKTRVLELMTAQGLDTRNELLTISITIIYLEAQRDQLAEHIVEGK